jgi:hypothetical protein
VQFFCSEEHYTAWRAVCSNEAGFLITFEQSARICHTFYGNLLDALA